MNETMSTRWVRRAITLPLYLLMFGLYTLALPLILPLAASIDLLRRSRWILTRVAVFFEVYLVCELAGILASFLIWLVAGPWTGRDHDTWIGVNRSLQHAWGRALGGTAFALFGIRVRVDADERFGSRPILLLIRHASTADTILAVNHISVPYDLPLRYVLKRELLWDPCLDIVGNRLPNVFVERGSSEPAAEVARIVDLLRGLPPREGVLIYPEGTRASSEKRRHIAEKLDSAGDAEGAAYARSLRAVLPPRPGGPLALLEHNPGLDVVFCAHRGLEGSASFAQLWNGGLVGAEVTIALRSFAPEDVPTDARGRLAWLREQWRRIDDFVDGRADL